MDDRDSLKLANMFGRVVASHRNLDRAKEVLMTKSKLYFDPVELFTCIEQKGDSESGGITENGLWEFLSETCPTFKRNEVSYIFRALDVNNSSYITLQEFLNIIYPEEIRTLKQKSFDFSELQSISSTSNRSTIRESKRVTLENYRSSKDRNLEAKCKIDFAVFLKELYKQHLAVDLAIKEVQAVMKDSHNLFRLLDPELKGYVTRTQLKHFLQSQIDIGRL